MADFTIDQTPPAPLLSNPPFNAILRGPVAVVGTAADDRFGSYRVEIHPVGMDGPVRVDSLIVGQFPVVADTFMVFDSRDFPDARYVLELIETDLLGLTSRYEVEVQIDNEFPFAGETSPRHVMQREGGDIYSIDSRARFSIPPLALSVDADVRVERADSSEVNFGGNLLFASPAWKVDIDPAALVRPATLSLSANGAAPDGTRLLVYRFDPEQGWSRVGGSTADVEGRIGTFIDEVGIFALVGEPEGGASSGAEVARVALMPRVLRGTRGAMGIGFTLDRSDVVTIRIVNRAGRVVRRLVENQTFGPGSNLVQWDGCDGNGTRVGDGAYFVQVAIRDDQRTEVAIVQR
jgi:hypothetical protein